mgnify:FL=1|tara:strand:- start:63 stop:1001 length:939 start_codon:yes stop_codon:yes gene_type:complete
MGRSVSNNNEIKSVDNSGLSEATREAMDLDANYTSGRSGAGIFGDSITEAMPRYIQSPCESVTQHGNSWIVLGRDRPASRASGYSGQGHTQASSIDIVVGRGAPVPTSDINVDPSFSTDAARIYISQKTDIDDNFKIVNGGMGSSHAKSGIGIKADAVRIVGTEGIKLVTRTSATNSKGGSVAAAGIELIAVNDEEGLQAMVKGQNMVDALTDLEERISDLSATVLTFLKAQTTFNASIASHTHLATQAPAGIIPTAPSIQLIGAGINATLDSAEAMIGNFKGRMNTNILWHNKYLNPMSSKYICSKYNKVN